MRNCVLLIISIILFIIDNSVIPVLFGQSAYPSTLLVFILCYSIVATRSQALYFGVIAGFLQDLYIGNVFGINAFANMIICIVANIIGDSIFKEKKFIPVISGFGLSLLKGIIIFSILSIIGQKVNYDNILFVSIYNMIITFFMYRFVFNLSQRPFMKVQWGFKKEAQ
jgi:rod shape-determining protein MreD